MILEENKNNSVEIQSIEDFDDFPLIFKELLLLFKVYQNLYEDRLVEDLNDFIQQLMDSFVEQYRLIQQLVADDFNL